MNRLWVLKDVGDEIFGNSFGAQAGFEEFLELVAYACGIAGSVTIEKIRNSLALWQAKCLGDEIFVDLVVTEGGYLVE